MKPLHSMGVKIFSVVATLILFMMVAVTYMLTIRQVDEQRRELLSNMGRIAKQIASIRLAETEGWFVYQEWIDNIIGSDIAEDIVYIAIFDEGDTLQAFSLNAQWLDLEDSNLTNVEQANVIRALSRSHVAKESAADFDHILIDIRWGRESLGKVDVGFSLIEFNNNVRQRLYVNLKLLGLFLIISLFVSIVVSRRITKPINRLSKAMLSVSRGNLDHFIKTNSHDEIGQLANSYNYMLDRLREKALIERFFHDLHFTLNLKELLRLIADQIYSALAAKNVILLQVEKYSDQAVAVFASSTPIAHCQDTSTRIPDPVYNLFQSRKEPVTAHAFSQIPGMNAFAARIQKIYGLTIDIISPLVNQSTLIGLLFIELKSRQHTHTVEENQLLATLSGQATMALENALLLRELTEKERMEKELEIARDVQNQFLPQSDPSIPGVSISGTCSPATEVGGDYFDYFLIDKRKVGIVIADVAGKGISAAFYMAEVKGMMVSLSKIFSSPKEVLLKVNQQLFNTLDKRIFVTMIYAVLDLRKCELTFVRAGHTPLLHKRMRKNKIDVLVPSGLGLGLADDCIFRKHVREKKLKLNRKDILVFYTDGVTDAMNEENLEFGEDRLIQLIQKSNTKNIGALQAEILQKLYEFTGNSPQHDDVTMVIVQLA